jgi:hypothetical protein
MEEHVPQCTPPKKERMVAPYDTWSFAKSLSGIPVREEITGNCVVEDGGWRSPVRRVREWDGGWPSRAVRDNPPDRQPESSTR